MKGSIEMTYRQPTAMSLSSQPSRLSPRTLRYYPWVIAVVVLGHIAVFVGLTQLQPQMIVAPVPEPVEIRWVELTPPPPPEPKPIPKPKPVPESKPPLPTPSKPKIVPVTPPPVAKAPAKILQTVAPTVKQMPKPVERVMEPKIEPTLSAAPVAKPAPPIPMPTPPVPTAIAAPVKAAPVSVPAPVVESPTAPPAEVVSAAPRTVAIAGVAYKRPPQVQYPEQARRRGDTGTVLVRALVGSNGRVDSATIEQSSGNRLLDQAAMRAVNRASFHPYRENGVAQSVYTLIPIAFTLNED